MSEDPSKDDNASAEGGGAILFIVGAVFVLSSILMYFKHPDRNWPAEEKIVTIYLPNDPALRKSLEEAKKRFEEHYKQEGYRVRTIWGTWSGYGQKIQFNEVARIQADVIYMDQKDFPQLTSRGILEDLTPLIGKELKVDTKKFCQPALQQLIFEDKLYALPFLFSPVQVYYNKTLFEKNGIQLPSSDPKHPWTYGNFLAAAKDLTQDLDGDGRVDQYGVGGLYHEWPAFVWREGGRVFSGDMEACLLDSPEAIRGLTRMDELYQKYKVVPPRTGLNEAARFSAGSLGMYFGTRFSIGRFLKIKDFEWGIAPVPRADATGLATTRIVVDSFALAKNGRNQKLGIKLLEFLVTEEMMREYAKSGSGLPGVKAVALLTVREDILGDKFFLTVPKGSRFFYRPPHAAKEMQTAFTDKLPLIWDSGVRTPREGARDAAALIRLGFKREAKRKLRFRSRRE